MDAVDVVIRTVFKLHHQNHHKHQQCLIQGGGMAAKHIAPRAKSRDAGFGNRRPHHMLANLDMKKANKSY